MLSIKFKIVKFRLLVKKEGKTVDDGIWVFKIEKLTKK